jgi:HlyD family secretion protein
MKVDYYDRFTAVFNVGKYDLLSLKVGQEATVSTLGSDYEAVVDYVSATATENTGLDISSIASSLTGAQNSSSSAVAKVKILNPDDKIIIGFDVDISVKTGQVDDVITLPVESLRFENGQKYIFVYKEETGTVEKRTVELGASEDTKYQISEGLSVGEIVIKNPLSSLKDGDKIVIDNTKTN